MSLAGSTSVREASVGFLPLALQTTAPPQAGQLHVEDLAEAPVQPG